MDHVLIAELLLSDVSSEAVARQEEEGKKKEVLGGLHDQIVALRH